MIDTREEIMRAKGYFELGSWFRVEYQIANPKKPRQKKTGWMIKFERMAIAFWGFHKSIYYPTFEEVYAAVEAIESDTIMLNKLKKKARIGVLAP